MKKCRWCKQEFTPRRPLQAVCSLQCGIDLAQAKRLKQEDKQQAETRRRDRKRRQSLKPLTEHLSNAQFYVNRYVRLRDRHKPCVSCGQSPYQGQRNASHYRSRAAAPQLRYNLLNLWTSCAQCNGMKSGNITEYRIELVRRIGEDRVLALEHNSEKAGYTVEYAQRVKSIFLRRAKYYQARADSEQAGI